MLIKFLNEYSDYVKNEESIHGKNHDKKLESCFEALFIAVRHERLFLMLKSSTDPDILKQSKPTDYEKFLTKKLAPKEIHRQRILKVYVAAQSS